MIRCVLILVTLSSNDLLIRSKLRYSDLRPRRILVRKDFLFLLDHPLKSYLLREALFIHHVSYEAPEIPVVWCLLEF